jgi:Na+/H+-dicarboxylate symporter
MAVARRSAGLFRSLTAWSLAALGGGFLLGALGHASGSVGFRTLAEALSPIGNLWLAALQMTVVPLVVVYTLAAITGLASRVSSAASPGAQSSSSSRCSLPRESSRWRSPPSFFGRTASIRRWPKRSGLRRSSPQRPTTLRRTATARSRTTRRGSCRRNLFQAAARGDVFALLVFSVLFGLAVTRLPDAERAPLTLVFRSLAAAMLLCVRWILVLMPIGVFAFAFRFGLASGGGGIRILGTYVGIVCGLMLLCTALLYPVTAAFGRTRVRAFARAVAPAQLIAVTTRSSIASLPALIQGARDRLHLPDAATGLVLPLSVSIFKLDITVSNVVKLLFLAHVYEVRLGAGTLTGFLLFVTLLSFSSPGLPSAGTFRTLPAFLAAGVPIEGVVLVQAMEAVPDVFMTLLNVTADLSAATLLTRSSRSLPAVRAVEGSNAGAGAA